VVGRYSPQRVALLEAIRGQVGVWAEVIDSHLQIIRRLNDRQQIAGFLHADLPVCGLAVLLADPLVHGVHARPCEVGFWVRQLGLVVRSGCLGQGQKSLGL
jgi:hypothetical protein